MVGSVLYGADREVAEFVYSRIAHLRGRPWPDTVGIGIVRGGKIGAGVLFHDYRGHDIAFGCAVEDRRCCTPSALRAVFEYPFCQLGCVRVSAVTGWGNAKARDGLRRLGFNLEGLRPLQLDGIDDAVMFGMLRQDCRWL